MSENDARQKLLDRVLECIQLKQESTSWDFKKEWYCENKDEKKNAKKNAKSEMLMDIICMANITDNVDGIIIFGVDEDNDYCVTGIENDPNRRKTQDLVCFLRDKDFAGGIRPVASVVSFDIDGHILDVIIVKNTTNTPYYLTKPFHDIEAYHIYTRVMDTNTPKIDSADVNITEALWKKRFGIGATAMERLTAYLKDADDWDSIDGERSYYNKHYPEFTIEHENDETRNGYEYYLFSQCDSNPYWYNIYIHCQQTMIYHTLGVALDGGRYFTVVPDYDNFHSFEENETVWFHSYTEGSFKCLLVSFFDSKYKSPDAVIAKDRLMECVPVFYSEQDKQNFLEYAAKHFSRKRKFVTSLGDNMPVFREKLPSNQKVDVIKEEYHDALIICDLLVEFRVGVENLPNTLV